MSPPLRMRRKYWELKVISSSVLTSMKELVKTASFFGTRKSVATELWPGSSFHSMTKWSLVWYRGWVWVGQPRSECRSWWRSHLLVVLLRQHWIWHSYCGPRGNQRCQRRTCSSARWLGETGLWSETQCKRKLYLPVGEEREAELHLWDHSCWLLFWPVAFL